MHHHWSHWLQLMLHPPRVSSGYILSSCCPSYSADVGHLLDLMMEAIGNITATCDVSRLQVEGKLFDSRIQGGILADGLNGKYSLVFSLKGLA
jgi:hypothetical protein